MDYPENNLQHLVECIMCALLKHSEVYINETTIVNKNHIYPQRHFHTLYPTYSIS